MKNGGKNILEKIRIQRMTNKTKLLHKQGRYKNAYIALQKFNLSDECLPLCCYDCHEVWQWFDPVIRFPQG
jgi:hypothetical protein